MDIPSILPNIHLKSIQFFSNLEKYILNTFEIFRVNLYSMIKAQHEYERELSYKLFENGYKISFFKKKNTKKIHQNSIK